MKRLDPVTKTRLEYLLDLRRRVRTTYIAVQKYHELNSDTFTIDKSRLDKLEDDVYYEFGRLLEYAMFALRKNSIQPCEV
jgi:hypothetical protein